ncbi:carboxypeptidase-like regulatory domain-containing protein [Ekhidna sp.]
MRSFIAIFLSLFSISLFSQRTLMGHVVDEEGEGLIGAHVYLLNNWRKGAITDIDGKYQLELGSGDEKDSLIVSYIGFEERLIPIQDGTRIELKPIETLVETVVVTAKPLIAEEFKYMEIKKLDIYTNPAAKADPILAVNSLPSATTTDESANISLRGSSPLETGVFMNSVPIYDGVRYSQLNGIGTFSIFNTAIIKGVTVFPGNPPLEFGNVTSGIIAMETDDLVLDGNANSLSISLASIGYAREQKINDRQSLKLFTNWQLSSPIKMVNESALEDIESFNSNDFGLYWYGSNNWINWKILGYGVNEGYEFNFQHPSFSGIFDQEKQRGFLISSFEKQVGNGTISINKGLSASQGDYTYSNVAFNVQKKDLFLSANYLLTRNKFNLKAGLSYDYRNSSIDGNFHELSYALNTNHPTLDLSNGIALKVLEGYSYLKYLASDKIAIGVGVRKNVPIDQISDYLSSQGNVSYSGDGWTITMGVGKYHKNSLVENTGEPFESESIQKSIDIKRDINGLEVALSLFDKNGTLNKEKYISRGLEVFTSYLFASKINTSASITLLDASNEGEIYAYDLSYFFRGNISYSPGRFWTIETTIVTRQGSTTREVASANYDEILDVYIPNYSEESLRLAYYSNIGLSVSKVFTISEKMNIIAFASINNILDRKNQRGFEYNADYTQRDNSLFSLRTGYFGAVINF